MADEEMFNQALALVKVEGEGIDVLKTRGLGLSMMLLALATVQTKRMGKLGKVVQTLEDRVFKEDEMVDLSGEALVSRYVLATKALGETSDYVGKVVNTIDWNDIQTQLVALTEGQTEKVSIRTAEAATALLKKLSERVDFETDKGTMYDGLPEDITEELDKPTPLVRRKVKVKVKKLVRRQI